MNDPKENTIKHIKIPLARPWFTEEEAQVAYEVVKSRWLIFGPQTASFENEFAQMMGAKYAVAVNSGSSALLVSLMALGIGEGDEVIVPDMTFVSTASCTMFVGARPVFADLELQTYGMNPRDIESRITKRTKLITPVHYAGQTADMNPIVDIARRYSLKVLEDAAESHLSEYEGKLCGTIGDMGIFSFTPSKPMTTGEGGMIVTNSEELAERARLIQNFGDTDRFKWDLFGYNFRMPDVMAAIGRVQLKKLEKAIEIRRQIAAKYTEGFKDEELLIVPYVRNRKDHNFQLYTVRLRLDGLTISRDDFIQKLGERGVSSRLYYPTLHTQKVFAKFGPFDDSQYPNAMEYARTAVSLPIFPDLTGEEINYVIESVKDIIRQYKR